MRRIGWSVLFALFGAAAVRTAAEPPPPPDSDDTQPVLLQKKGKANGVGPYVAPKLTEPVAELLDENVDPVFQYLTLATPATITREDRDVFTGVEAIRVTPSQKYRTLIPGWRIQIVETPKNQGEYRYLRFAWKKLGGSGIVIRFYVTGRAWLIGYHNGKVPLINPRTQELSDKLPTDWELVTVDLFKQFGACTITGVWLGAVDGTAALFDHVLVGRTIADLDAATDEALGRIKPAKPVDGQSRDELWDDLIGTDRAKAAVAMRAFLATAPDQVAFVRTRLADRKVDTDQSAHIAKLLMALNSDSFDARHAATYDLIKIGAPAAEAVRELNARPPNDEVAYRTTYILRKIGGNGAPVSEASRLTRAVRILERAGTKDARELLTKLAEGECGPSVAEDAKAALQRMPKKP